MIEMVTLRGIPKRQIDEYLSNEGCSQVENSYLFSGCVVTICKETDVKIGSLSIPELAVEFSGDEVKVVRAIEQFKKAFMRMGG